MLESAAQADLAIFCYEGEGEESFRRLLLALSGSLPIENVNNIMYVTNDPSGQKAVTWYNVIKEKEGYALLSVQIDTGRKNQIRAQLENIGHPIVGDDKYGKPKDPIARLGLHASKLVLTHPHTKEQITFNASLPPVFYSLF